MGKWLHRLSNVDKTAKTGSCAHCGEVRVMVRKSGRTSCEQALAYRKKRYEDAKGPPEYDYWLAIQRKYGITKIDYERMADSQNQTCAICRTAPDSDIRLFVDHCHDSGKVRGLLCRGCNTGIGMLQDNPEILRSAAMYLET